MTEPNEPATQSEANPTLAQSASKLPTWAPPALIVFAGCLAYANSFRGAFIFDDRDVIVNNFDIRQLWPPWAAMFGPQNIYRPLVGLTLAINHAISGFDVWSYHGTNLLIHLLAALALFGIVRRTLITESLHPTFGRRATLLAFLVALIWTVHPLQTQSITYIIQRGESMMGLFLLTTLYCSMRGFESERKAFWQGTAILACIAGMLSKQVMVTAPLIVLIYDFMFVSGSFVRAVRRSKFLYAGLAGSWIVLGTLILLAPPSETAGFAVQTVTPLEYFESQFGVLVHYLRLSVWPNPLVLDYAWPKAGSVGEVLPHAIMIGLLFLATIAAIARRKPIGFLGAWFFIILSITSSFMPLADLAFEHRMYLPLAAVIALLILGAYAAAGHFPATTSLPNDAQLRLGSRLALVSLTVIVVSLIFMTAERNEQYRDAVYMWRDVVSKRPENARAHNNLGMLLAERGQVEEAVEHFSAACNSNTTYVEAHNNLGLALLSLGNFEEGKGHLLQAVHLKPTNADAHYNLGRAFAAEGQFDEALEQFRITLELDQRYVEAEYQTGLVLEKKGNPAEALRCYERVLAARPAWPGALSHVGVFLATRSDPAVRDLDRAIALAEKAVSLTNWNNPILTDALARVYAEAGRLPDAVRTADRALALAIEANDQAMANDIRARIHSYEEGNLIKARRD